MQEYTVAIRKNKSETHILTPCRQREHEFSALMCTATGQYASIPPRIQFCGLTFSSGMSGRQLNASKPLEFLPIYIIMYGIINI